MLKNDPLGKPISRHEALTIAKDILVQAEKDRERFFDEFYFYMVENRSKDDDK